MLHYKRAATTLLAIAAVAALAASLASAQQSRRFTLTGPGIKLDVDLATFADPLNPADTAVMDVLEAFLKNAPHAELLARVLQDPARRALYERLVDGSSTSKDEEVRLSTTDGNDVVFIVHGDNQLRGQGGKGYDIAVLVGDRGVTLNLTQAGIEVALGGPGADILIGGGRRTVWIDGGPGRDIIIGGAANDVLSGGDGDDLVDGGQGNDVIRGGPGKDTLMGGTGDDQISGGPGDDRLSGGTGNDVLRGDEGDDRLEGGDGIDMASYTGDFGDYRLFRIDDRQWRIADTRHGRDGSDTLSEIERLNFADWWAVPLDRSNPLPVDDRIDVRDQLGRGVSHEGRDLHDAYFVAGPRLVSNDISLSGYPIYVPVLVDRDGRDVGPDRWAQMNVGRAWLTQQGDVIYQGPVSGALSFRYRIADTQGHSSASAMRSETGKPAPMWGNVYLQVSAPRPPVMRPRECSDTCTLDPGETTLVLTGTDAINGTGNDLPNVLTGNANDNVLDGGPGPDLMQGGPGNDYYFVDHPGDRVVESPNGGNDTVWTRVEGYILPPHVENLILGPGIERGTGNDHNNVLRGNWSDNTLTGGPGDDLLDGGAGADTLSGGPGDDRYVVDDPGDKVIERENEGQDTVMASISYTLPAHVENLILTGSDHINGTGNDLANRLTGNAGDNILIGGGGDDTLRGGAGNDTLQGGPGNDTYLFGAGDGNDTIIEDDPTPGKLDMLVFTGFIRHEAVWLARSGDDLVATVSEGASVTIRNWYRGAAHRIERMHAGPRVLAPDGVEKLVAAMSGLERQTDAKGMLVPVLRERLAPVIEEVWRPR